MTDHRIPTDELKADLRRVAEIVGGVPTEAEYNEYGEYSSYTLRQRFGSVPAAREAANLEQGRTYDITKDELVKDLRRVAECVGRPPSQSEYQEHGKYTHPVFYSKFGSWVAAREAAGLSEGPQQNQKIANESLLDEIRRVADHVGRIPAESDMIEYGDYADVTYISRFGSWTEAVREAGFEPRERGAQPGSENPSWEGGSIEHYYGPNWLEQRQRCLERDNYECQHCGMSDAEHNEKWGHGLNVHHIIERRAFLSDGVFDWESANQVQNLVALCNRHHEEYEGTRLRPHNVPEATG